MSTTSGYFNFISEQLSLAENVSYRKMMGEYIIYSNGKVVGGIYDDRLLIKPTNSARSMMPDALLEEPYDGAKPMILVDNTDDKEFLAELLSAVEKEIPDRKKRK